MKVWAATAMAAGVLLAAACHDAGDPILPEEPRLEFTVAFEPPVLTRGEAVTVTVTAKNPTQNTVSLGLGSSSCALGALVWHEGESHGMILGRACTADIRERIIEAGETRTERWDWSGDIWLNGGLLTLPAGIYEVAGTGGKFVGEPVSIEIVEPEERVEMSIAIEPPVLTLGNSVVVTVIVRNDSETRVLLGTATSCLIHASVAHEGETYVMITDRICFFGVRDVYLDAGATLTSSWNWRGVVMTQQGHKTLPPGTYEATGFVPRFASEPILVEIRE